MEDEKKFVEELLSPLTQEKAFKTLMDRYQKPLYMHIRTIVLNHDDTHDILQNTFIKIFNHIKNFKGESKLYSWIYRIATNEALSFLQQKAKKQNITSETIREQYINTLPSDPYFDGNEIQLKLQRAISLLPEKQQLVFKMRYFQEIKYEDLSEILNTSVGALKASYHHAVKKIEDYLSEN